MQALGIPAKVFARDADTAFNAVMVQHLFIVLENRVHLIFKLRVCNTLTCAQICHDLIDKPGLAIATTTDHHAICPRISKRLIRILKRIDIAVDDNRDVHRLLHNANLLPVGMTSVHLAAGTAMDHHHLDASLFSNLGKFRRVEAGVIPTETHLERHWQ